jgi:hypothetical protein
MAEPAQRRTLAGDPATNPIAARSALRDDARTEDKRACLAVAERQADRVWIALHTGRLGLSVPATTVPPRSADWYRLALSAYDLVRESPAHRHLAQLLTVDPKTHPFVSGRPFRPLASDPQLLTGHDPTKPYPAPGRRRT